MTQLRSSRRWIRALRKVRVNTALLRAKCQAELTSKRNLALRHDLGFDERRQEALERLSRAVPDERRESLDGLDRDTAQRAHGAEVVEEEQARESVAEESQRVGRAGRGCVRRDVQRPVEGRKGRGRCVECVGTGEARRRGVRGRIVWEREGWWGVRRILGVLAVLAQQEIRRGGRQSKRLAERPENPSGATASVLLERNDISISVNNKVPGSAPRTGPRGRRAGVARSTSCGRPVGPRWLHSPRRASAR